MQATSGGRICFKSDTIGPACLIWDVIRHSCVAHETEASAEVQNILGTLSEVRQH